MTCIAIVFVVVSLRLHYQLLNERDNASGYQSGYESVRDALDDTFKKLEAAQRTAELRQRKCDALQYEINDLQFKWAELNQENSQLTAQNAALLDQLAEARESLKRDQVIMSITNDVAELNFNQKEAAEAKVAELLDKLAVADSDLQEAKAEVAKLRADLEATEEACNDEEAEHLDTIDENERLRERIKQLEAEAREQQELLNEAARDRVFDCDPRD